MCRPFLVVGTDTGVGKTVVTAAVAQAFRFLFDGRPYVMKPVQSGASRDDWAGDAQCLKRWAQVAEDIQWICPYAFLAPIAPPWSAAIEGRCISVSRLQREISDRFAAVKKVDGDLIERDGEDRRKILLVEGAGGFLSPLATSGGLFADLAKELSWPLILVSPVYTGAINSIMLTYEAICRRGLSIQAVVFNSFREQKVCRLEANTMIGWLSQRIPEATILLLPHIQTINGENLREILMDNFGWCYGMRLLFEKIFKL